MSKARLALRHEPLSRRVLEGSIPARFGDIVQRFPDRMAVKTRHESLSYAQLNRRANRIAGAILAAIGPEPVPVALLLDQSVTLVATILGVLKAGKLYLPLAPGHPRAHLLAQLRDGPAAVILTDRTHFGLAQSLAERHRSVLHVTELDAPETLDDPGLPLGPETLAYIFYTSGSTGKPKGVYDNHRNVLHNIMRYTNSLAIGPEDRLTLLQACSFSGSVSSLFCALLNGATVYPMDVKNEGITGLADWIKRERMTMYHSVPSIFQQLMACETSFPDLRVIRLEGDRASARHVELFRKHFTSPCVLVNGLGATETGITRQYSVRPDDDPPPDGVVPIGYATEDMDALVLDEFGDPVGSGETGEIAIRSRYLACGYWRNPKLTREAFRPSRDDPTLRTYRTGDVGRFRADGCLEFLGRTDFQVKVLGQRVEVEAVEAALTGLDGIELAVVTAWPRRRGDRRLVAHVVASGVPPTVTVMRRALAVHVPAFMIPSAYVVLDALPLDDNGKVDRKALPPPTDGRPAVSTPYEPPEGEREARMASVWERVLGVTPVGRHDDFFDLGGDSMHAAEIMTIIEKSFGVRLPEVTLFDSVTVAELTAVVSRNRPSASLVAMQPAGSRSPFFCVHAHDGQVLGYSALARHVGEDRPFYALQARGLDGQAAPLGTVEEMAEHYVREIRTIKPRGPYVIGGNCFGAVVAYEMAHQLVAQGEQIDRLVLIDPDPRPSPPAAGTERDGPTGEAPTDPSPPRPSAARRHWHRLAALSGRARVAYVTSRLGHAGRRIGERVAGRFALVAPRFLGVGVQRLPSAMWRSLFTVGHSRAGQQYRFRPCACPAVLLYAEVGANSGEDVHPGWRALIGDSLELRGVPCRRHQMLREPFVREVRRHLGEALADL